MGLLDTPLTQRYNNPGAIEYQPWMEKYGATVGPNGRYAQFADPQAGYNVMGKVLDTYRDKHGLNTVSGIVGRWAPANVDNNSTSQYAASVAKKLGIDPNAPLTPEQRPALMQAMASYEAGKPAPMPGGMPTGPAPGSFRAAQENGTSPAPEGGRKMGLLDSLMAQPGVAPTQSGQQPSANIFDRLATNLQSPLAMMAMGALTGKTVGDGLMTGVQAARQATMDRNSRDASAALAQAMPAEYRAAMERMTAPEALNLFNHYSQRQYQNRQMDYLQDHRARQIDIAQQKLQNWRDVKEQQAEIARDRSTAWEEIKKKQNELREQEQKLKQDMSHGAMSGGAPAMQNIGFDSGGGFYLRPDSAQVPRQTPPSPSIGTESRSVLPVDQVGSTGGFVPTSNDLTMPGVSIAPFHPGAKAIARQEAQKILDTTDVSRLDPRNPQHSAIIQQLGDAFGGGKLDKGKRWSLDANHRLVQEDIPGATKLTAGERTSAAMAKMGLDALDFAQPILVGATDGNGNIDPKGEPATSGAVTRFVSGPTTIKGHEVMGGFGETGRAFRAMKGAVMDLNFYLSGKSVSDKERQAMMDIYMPQTTDGAETLAWKHDRLRRYFKIVQSVRDGVPDDDKKLQDATRSAISDGKTHRSGYETRQSETPSMSAFPQPSDAHIQALRSNTSKARRDAFDSKFGPGASDAALRGR